MKIAYLASLRYRHTSPSGGQQHVKQFLKHFAAAGHQVLLYHGGEYPDPAIQTVPRSRLQRFNALRQVDILYYRVENKPPREAKWITPLWRKLIGNPPAVFEFNTVPEYGREQGASDALIAQHIAGLRQLAPHVDATFCVSQAITDYVQSKLGFRRVQTVPNGSDPQMFRPDVPGVRHLLPSPRLKALWIGSADVTWHNFDQLREAAWLLWDGGTPAIEFHIIGQGFNSLRDWPANVYYHGPEQYEHLPSWLSQMDVGLNVYRAGAADYSCPLKLFDYMASGLTLVSTDQPQVREIFQKLNQIDLLVPHNDPAPLAAVLRALAGDRDRVKRQGAAARQLAVSFYNWKRAATDTLEVMEGLVKARKRG